MSTTVPHVHAGVGKSSLVHMLAHDNVLADPKHTIGLNGEVLVRMRSFMIHSCVCMCGCDYAHVQLFELSDSTGRHSYPIHFWDVGGSTRYANARRVFYGTYHGSVIVVLVCFNHYMD